MLPMGMEMKLWPSIGIGVGVGASPLRLSVAFPCSEPGYNGFVPSAVPSRPRIHCNRPQLYLRAVFCIKNGLIYIGKGPGHIMEAFYCIESGLACI